LALSEPISADVIVPIEFDELGVFLFGISELLGFEARFG